MDSGDLGWLAGAFEAEGSAGIYWNGLKPKPFLSFSNTDPSFLQAVRDIIGSGTVNGPYHRTTPRWKDNYVFQLTTPQQMVDAISLILPHTHCQYKQKQLVSILEFAKQPIPDLTNVAHSIDWVASVWEGEGCAGCYFHKDYRCKPMFVNGEHRCGHNRFEIVISNTQQDLMEEIQTTLGFGHVRFRPRKPPRQNQWSFGLESHYAKRFADLIFPHIRSKVKLEQLTTAYNAVTDPLVVDMDLHGFNKTPVLNLMMPNCGHCMAPLISNENWSGRSQRAHSWLCDDCRHALDNKRYHMKNSAI